MDQTIDSLKKGYENTTVLNSGRNYFDIMLSRYKADPATYNAAVAKSEAKGKLKALQFLTDMKDPKNGNRDEALKSFNDKFNADEREVYNYYIAAQYKADKIQPFEHRSEGTYERRLISRVVIHNDAEQKMVNDCRDLFQKKWAAEGYNGDKAVMALFQKENPDMPGTVDYQIRK